MPAPPRQRATPEPPAPLLPLKHQWQSLLIEKFPFLCREFTHKLGPALGSGSSAREQVYTRSPTILPFPGGRLPGDRDSRKTELRNEEGLAVALEPRGRSWTLGRSFHRWLGKRGEWLPCLAGAPLAVRGGLPPWGGAERSGLGPGRAPWAAAGRTRRGTRPKEMHSLPEQHFQTSPWGLRRTDCKGELPGTHQQARCVSLSSRS